MDPVQNLRAVPGEAFTPSASGFNLLADFANDFRKNRLGGGGGSLDADLPLNQLVARVKNNSNTITYQAGDVIAIGKRATFFPGDPIYDYPSGWYSSTRFHEINDEPLLSINAAGSNEFSYLGVFLGPCPPGMIARVCIGGLCYSRVQKSIDGSFSSHAIPLKAGTPNYWTHLRSRVAQLGILSCGNARIVQVFEDYPTVVSGVNVYPALVEINCHNINPRFSPYPVLSSTYGSPDPYTYVLPGHFFEGIGFYSYSGTAGPGQHVVSKVQMVSMPAGTIDSGFDAQSPYIGYLNSLTSSINFQGLVPFYIQFQNTTSSPIQYVAKLVNISGPPMTLGGFSGHFSHYEI